MIVLDGIGAEECGTYLSYMALDPPPDIDPPPIGRRYLLVINIPCYHGEDGSLWLEPLWHRDFVRHLEYIRHLTLAAPCLPKPERSDLVEVVPPPGSRLSSVPLPRSGSAAQFVRNLPRTLGRLWRAIGDADIVHSGVAGWPVPLGWLASPIALIRGKELVIVVESAPWRLTGPDAGWRRKVRAAVAERLARWAVNHASLSFFTQESYRRTLLTHAAGASAVVPATWIDEADLLDADSAAAAWRHKAAVPVRLLFAGRLTADKGINVLRRAVAALRARQVAARIDIIGAGEERAACEEMAAASGSVAVRLLDPVAPDVFLGLVQGYHAVLVPSLSDEQPRLVFDASSQAVPVIASSTDGLRPHVRSGETGWLFPPGDAAALAAAIERALAEPAALQRMGLAALRSVMGSTHREMHRARWRWLAEQLGKTRLPGGDQPNRLKAPVLATPRTSSSVPT
jgi:glycosyltransferase involved in cell wall biosynthesis